MIYHWAILATGLACALIFVFLNYSGPGQLLFLLTLPLLFINAKAVQTKKTSDQIDPYLKQMALASLLFVVLFGIGQLLPIS